MKKTVVCIDDDLITLKICRKILSSTGFCSEILTFSSADEALAQLVVACLNNNRPDLILLDLNMPVKDGWQFLKEIQERCPDFNTPVLILSSSIDPADAARSRQFRTVIDFIHKPLTAQKLEKYK
jgi:CheY-like chemotaxis protein